MNEFDALQLAISIATKHGKHNQKTHGRRYGSVTGQTAMDVARSQGMDDAAARKFAATAIDAYKSAPLAARDLVQEMGIDGAHEMMTNAMNNQYSNAEFYSLRDYQGYGYEEINKALRAGEPADDIDNVSFIDLAMKRNQLPENIIITRGLVKYDDSAVLKALTTEGAVVKDAGYMSTTLDREVSRYFSGGNVKDEYFEEEGKSRIVMNIRAPAGYPATYFPAARAQQYGSADPGEAEVLFPRNTNILIRGVKKVRGGYEIDAEILP